MNIKEFPEINSYLPIDIDKCKQYWDTKINGFNASTTKIDDWKKCDEYLEIINNKELPLTLRTYIFTVKLPFIVANYIIESKNYETRNIELE